MENFYEKSVENFFVDPTDNNIQSKATNLSL